MVISTSTYYTMALISIAVLCILVIQHNDCEIERINLESYPVPNCKVVVSFTTIPSRIRYLPDVAKRLRNQTLKPDEIYACIPYYSKRLNQAYPKSIGLVDDTRVVRCPDYGPATKLLGCLPYETDPDTIIITIDDDQEYRPQTISLLVNYAKMYPESAIGIHSLTPDLKNNVCRGKNIASPRAQYLEGYGGIAYRRGFFNEGVWGYFEKVSKCSECFISDDLAISWWLKLQGIQRIKLCEGDTRTTIDEINDQDPLREIQRQKTYSKCLSHLSSLD